MFKFGLELFSSCGTALFELAERSGIKIFFDGKFHDIPNTVAQASRAIARQKVAMFNLHATGGSAMMRAAAAAVKETAVEIGIQPPALIAVTILTSMKAETLAGELNVSLPLEQMVPHLAKMAQDAGLDGVVASAKEASAIRQACGPEFLIVTPGIRPSWAASDDQARIVTPKDAIAGGADYIVVGHRAFLLAAAKQRKKRIERSGMARISVLIKVGNGLSQFLGAGVARQHAAAGG